MNKTHVIDGVTYVEVERKAEVGDKIIVDNPLETDDNYKDGDILTVCRYVHESPEEYEGVEVYFGNIKENYFLYPQEFTVLEPLESEECCVDTSQASPEVIDLLSNLARRVTSLEQQLRDNQRNIETWAEELENAKHRIRKHEDRFGVVEERVGMLTDDVITLDERTQPLVEKDVKIELNRNGIFVNGIKIPWEVSADVAS